METTRERTISGRALVVGGLVVTVVVIAAAVVFGPALREDVRQEQGPRTLREPVASGMHQGQPWEAIGRYDGTANCVELRYEAEVLGRACDAGAEPQAVTELPDGGPTIAYGIAPEDQTEVTRSLSSGEEMTAVVKAGELGFPVGFWAAEIPRGTTVEDGSVNG